jgi:DNA-binding transcriptional regulator GbsR (MarR family)
MRLSAMPAEEFFQLFREVLEEKPSGKEKIQRMVNEIVRELEENDDDEEDEEEDDDILSKLGL